MIKLFTLHDITSDSAEALYKICLNLDKYGLTDQNVFQLDSYDEIFEEAQKSLAKGDFVLIAPEANDYLRYKFEFISSSVIASGINEGLATLVSNSYINSSTAELEAHCTVPVRSTVHASDDGLYSGFSVEVLNGLCTVLPLDFGRLDSILNDYIVTFIDSTIGYVPPKINIRPEETDDYEDYSMDKGSTEAVSRMIYSLIHADSTIAIANGEAALHIYNLYDRIKGLSDVTGFVEILDPEEGAEAVEEKNHVDDMPPVTHFSAQDNMPSFVPVLDDNGEQLYDENGDPIFEPVINNDGIPTEYEDVNSNGPVEENDQPSHPVEFEDTLSNSPEVKPVKKESASAKTIRHAREAKRNMNSTYGAAISDIYSAVDENGATNYFIFVSVADGKTVKAKKICTTNANEAADLLFHGITVLSETIIQRIEAERKAKLAAEKERAALEEANKPVKQEPKFNPVILAAIIGVVIVSIVAAIVIAKIAAKPAPTEPQQSISYPTYATNTSTTEAPTNPTIPGLENPSNQNQNGEIPGEPAATDVSAMSTAAPVPSTSGTFTFYVFGYGHGVGLSQNGAKYYASQGWNYAQILANYFYGTTLMSGEVYPDKITYNGTDYNTREFIACVLEAEISSSSPVEALRAQAVCIYTFAKYYNYRLEASSMAYKPNPSQASYDAADFVMKNGLYLSYGGQTALTPFHSTSAGVTTSYYNVWGGTALNYLAGGRPSYGDYNSDEFKSTVTLTSAELKALVEGSDPTIKLTGDPATWISIISHDAAVNSNVGYVSTIRVGGKEVSGNEFRTKLLGGKLRSHCFTFTYTPDAQ